MVARNNADQNKFGPAAKAEAQHCAHPMKLSYASKIVEDIKDIAAQALRKKEMAEEEKREEASIRRRRS